MPRLPRVTWASRSPSAAATRVPTFPCAACPVHAAEGYLQRLIRIGHRVAVCEQLEDPAEARKRGSKSVVRRDVVRLVTPGTLTEDSLLDQRSHNYLAAIARLRGSGEAALAWADISSGELAVQPTTPGRLAADLARLGPSEILVPDSLLDEHPYRDILKAQAAPVTPLPGVRFDSVSAEHRLRTHFGVAALEAFGSFSKAETAALGGLIEYITLTQVGRMPYLRPPLRQEPAGFLLVDAATRANLELTRSLNGDRRGSLLAVIDRTVTASGARLPGRTPVARRSPIRTRSPRGSTRSTSSSPRHRCAAPCRQRSRRCPISSGPLAA